MAIKESTHSQVTHLHLPWFIEARLPLYSIDLTGCVFLLHMHTVSTFKEHYIKNEIKSLPVRKC